MIKTHKPYYPLYEDKEKFIYLITGGRGSGKTTAVSAFIERLTFEYNKEKQIAHQILYTRYTMASAGMSIIPEFLDKVQLDGTEAYFHKANNDVINTMTKSRVMFRGINTSSGNQTAKLKSIQGVTTFVVDEAEEWVNEDEFERVMLSIRQVGLQNRVIIIMNPCDSNHWVYQRFIKDTHRIEYFDGVPVQISTHPNVLHIHTSYLDNIEFLSEQFMKEILSMKQNNPERYAHVVMGQWADVAEGAVFKKWGIVDEFPEYAKKISRAMDFGYTCFKGDTLITTMRGDIPIKDVEIGDMVLTRKGYRRVLNKMHNGIKKVITKEIIVNGTKHLLSATYEHNINANGKWKKYGELTEKDNLFVLSSIKGLNTEDTQVANTQIITTTDGKAKGNIIKNSCTTLSMRIISGKYQMGKLYTILTKIRSITSHLTLWLSLLQNIVGYTMKNWLTIKQQNTQELSVLQKKTGNKGEEKLTRNLQIPSRNANNAVKSLFQRMFTKDSAQNIVTTNGSMLHQRITQNSHASAVEKSLWEINTLNQKPAQTSVLINSQGIEAITTLGEERCDVYDLEIDGVHEYFANGILVHNCDPTAIVRCGIVGNRLYVDELCYKTGMTSGDIIRELRAEEERGEGGFVYSESADPRLIDEIALGGIIIYPVVKGQGSIREGLSKMLDMELYVTKRSVNLQEELRNYVYAKDKFGNYTNYPEDHHNHGIGDATRYYVMGCLEGKVMQPKRVTKQDFGVY